MAYPNGRHPEKQITGESDPASRYQSSARPEPGNGDGDSWSFGGTKPSFGGRFEAQEGQPGGASHARIWAWHYTIFYRRMSCPASHPTGERGGGVVERARVTQAT
ncbi:uncharacterized protein N7459_001437 [Penicillium hispanicum]|uniref:uncharacterized protein n=1 Tax=Penicillium hispanicum TaxID=1080232 RepID=UPI002541D93D|nr:uncharacterized protein N7459_001437 [Penicillium hispanicum]KAJ5595229.1 hypothetical protein N7459_001437 [Penicillium hispanicum]